MGVLLLLAIFCQTLFFQSVLSAEKKSNIQKPVKAAVCLKSSSQKKQVALPRGFLTNEKISQVAYFLYQAKFRKLQIHLLQHESLSEFEDQMNDELGFFVTGNQIYNFVRKQKERKEIWNKRLVEEFNLPVVQNSLDDHRLLVIVDMLINHGIVDIQTSNLHRLSLAKLAPVMKAEFGQAFTGKRIDYFIKHNRKEVLWQSYLGSRGIPRDKKALGRHRVRSVLQKRIEKGVGSTTAEILSDKSSWFSELLKETYGEAIENEHFYHHVKRYFGTPKKALKSTRLFFNKGITEEKVISFYHFLFSEHSPIDLLSLVYVRSLKFQSREFGSGYALNRYVSTLFGSWQVFIELANKESLKIKAKNKQGIGPNIIKCFNLFYKELLEYPTPKNVAILTKEQLGPYTKKVLKKEYSGKQFVRLVQTHFVTWEKFLAANESDLEKEMTMSFYKSLFEEHSLPNIAIAGYVKQLKFKSKEFRTGVTLYRRIRKLFGTWAEFLVANGINPDEVNLYGWAKFEILTPEMQQERIAAVERESALKKKGGGFNDEGEKAEVIDEDTPESLFMESEQAFYNFKSSLNQRDAEHFGYFESAFRILSSQRALTEENILRKMRELGSTITAGEYTSFMALIDENSEEVEWYFFGL